MSAKAVTRWVPEESEEAPIGLLELSGTRDHIGFLLLDAKGSILRTNSTARRLLEEDDGLSESEQQLVIADAPAARRLERILQQCAALDPTQGGAQVGVPLLIPRPSGQRRYEVLVTPASAETSGSPGAPQVTILICDPTYRPEVNPEILQAFYGLTPVEANVAASLAGGLSVDEVATRLNVSRHTIRNHLKQVFWKTDTHRQGELVARLVSGLAMFRS